ncbi:DUF1800 domain-containing protein [Membranihabitans maritimus]|uniref:DUF1800 domain-containing protein n=1 Tax=Membranihabitans maritimus TaxID=2904244 RepID=UPI001F358852|nr:DUF1800 domain-containing protein [Membranihabitans maritimus]
MKKIILYLLIIYGSTIFAQTNSTYLGAGNDNNIKVYSSSNYTPPGRNNSASAENTINGSGLDGPRQSAARFLSQATFGANDVDIDLVLESGFGNWIDEQIAKPSPSMLNTLHSVYQQGYQLHLENGGEPDDYYGPYWIHFQYAFWQNNIMNQDALRQKVAWALSQIFVISIQSDLEGRGEALASFYDVLLKNALGNFEDLLQEVTLHPAMGYYLSHYNNPKVDPETNIHPDENYAREVMQLFTIGLHELNVDGTVKYNGAGNPVPTYDMNTISEMARVFTGLGPGGLMRTNEWVQEPFFGLDIYFNDLTVPMTMYEEYHDNGEKVLIDGTVLPAGQGGIKDIKEALHTLFMHPNTGPFITRRLIQHLVKSNPSPAYIERISSVFNNNGQGKRGDLGAVVKAILLDPEARTCEWIQEPSQGKLRDPFVRYLNVVRSMDLNNSNGIFWNTGYEFWNSTGQVPLAAPSVFNFYLPDYQTNAFKSNGNLYSPVFQIHNTKTSLDMINQVYQWTMHWNLLRAWDPVEPTFLDYNNCEPLAKDPEVLINKLDILFTHGQMDPFTRKNIREAIEKIRGSNLGADYLEYRSALALYLTLISPDFTILK